MKLFIEVCNATPSWLALSADAREEFLGKLVDEQAGC